MSLSKGKIIFINESKFHMWRASFAALHLDGVVSPQEKAWAEEKLNFLRLDQKQKEILRKDLEQGPSLEEIIPHITDKVDLAFLVHLFRTLGHLDGQFSPDEKQAYQDLEKRILSHLPMEKIEKEISHMEDHSYRLEEVHKVHNRDSLLEHVFKKFLVFVSK